MVRYDELVVDGRTIVKKGSKPRWMVSDYDGNAVLQVSGKDLPPSVRGLLEIEVMRLQREAAVTRDGIRAWPRASTASRERLRHLRVASTADDQVPARGPFRRAGAEDGQQYLAKYGDERWSGSATTRPATT